jgi:glycosyltransferase involved in cell wall biosynthesis
VAVSDDARRLTVQADRVRSDKVMRIWNGIDISRFGYRGPAADPVAITVARLSPEKDLHTLLRAMHLAVQEVPELRLIIVGDGPQRADLEKMCAALGLESQVQFLGERHDVHDLLGRAGFVVSSSMSEGISLTLLEAMAVGLPVVATAAGGTPEIIEDGTCGRTVPVGDTAALAQAMVEMCRRQSEWPAIGRAGRQRVAEHFEVRRMVAEYEELYARIASAKRTAPDSKLQPFIPH